MADLVGTAPFSQVGILESGGAGASPENEENVAAVKENENATHEQIKKEEYLVKELSVLEHLVVAQRRYQVIGNQNINMLVGGGGN